MRRPLNQIIERQIGDKWFLCPSIWAKKNSENLQQSYLWILIKRDHVYLLNFIIYFLKNNYFNHKRNLVCMSHYKFFWLFSAHSFFSFSGLDVWEGHAQILTLLTNYRHYSYYCDSRMILKDRFVLYLQSRNKTSCFHMTSEGKDKSFDDGERGLGRLLGGTNQAQDTWG